MWSFEDYDFWSFNIAGNSTPPIEYSPNSIMNRLNDRNDADNFKYSLALAGLYAGSFLLGDSGLLVLIHSMPYFLTYFYCDLIAKEFQYKMQKNKAFSEAIEEINIKDYKMNETACPICLEKWNENKDITKNNRKIVKIKSCKHVFHNSCIKAWYQHVETPNCPLCKTKI